MDQPKPAASARAMSSFSVPSHVAIIMDGNGEQRLSNFLLRRAAYSELVFVPVRWSDFDRASLEQAIAEFHSRERRFDGLVAKIGS